MTEEQIHLSSIDAQIAEKVFRLRRCWGAWVFDDDVLGEVVFAPSRDPKWYHKFIWRFRFDEGPMFDRTWEPTRDDAMAMMVVERVVKSGRYYRCHIFECSLAGDDGGWEVTFCHTEPDYYSYNSVEMFLSHAICVAALRAHEDHSDVVHD